MYNICISGEDLSEDVPGVCSMKRILSRSVPKVSLIYALIYAFVMCSIFSAFIFGSCGKMGYDVEANVDSSTWSIHRSTQGLDFISQGVVVGQGNFSKSSEIEGSTGINARERSSSTRRGNLSFAEQLILRSREGPVVVKTKLVSGSNTTTNASQISVRESAKIEIDESWPTYFASYKKISYLGRGMRESERYSNDDEVVSTYLDSWKLSKESLYKAHLNRTLVSVNITPGYVFEERSANRSSYYAMELDSVGASTRLDVQNKGSYGRPVQSISQEYVGQEKMSVKVEMSESLILPKGNDSWLECCP
jgi:hypothetical protein